jgi:hypothetical protein
MIKQQPTSFWMLAIAGAIGLTTLGIAASGQKEKKELAEQPATEQVFEDSTPRKKKSSTSMTIHIDNMEGLQASIQKMLKTLQEELPKLNIEINRSLKKLKDIDWCDSAGKKNGDCSFHFDFDSDIDIDLKDMDTDIQESLKAIRVEEIEIDKAVKDAMREMRKNKLHLHFNMSQLDTKMKKLDIKMRGFTKLLDDLKKEGLIKDTKNLNIDWKDGDLYINGEKQPKAVTERFKKYFDAKGTFKLNWNDDKDSKEQQEESPKKDKDEVRE